MAAALQWEEIASKNSPKTTVFCIHGRGANGEDLIPLADEIDLPDTRWLFPHAPFPCPGLPGGRMWFGTAAEGLAGIENSRTLLIALIDLVIQNGPNPAEKLVLLGFSQGAVMALDAGLRYPKRLGAITALSGFLARPETLHDERSEASKTLPILLVHGTEDEIVTVDGSRKARETLAAEGYEAQLKEYPMGHQIVQEEINLIRTFLMDKLDLT